MDSRHLMNIFNFDPGPRILASWDPRDSEIVQSMILGSQGHVSILRSWKLDLRYLISHMLASMSVGSQDPGMLDLCPMMVIVTLQGVGSQDGEICICEFP